MSRQASEEPKSVGEGLQACGCILFLLPILIICLVFLYGAVSGLFH